MLTSRHALEREKIPLWGSQLAGRAFHETTQKMSENRILVRLLRMHFPRIWEFGSALLKLRNFGGLTPPSPVRHASDTFAEHDELMQCTVTWVNHATPKKKKSSINDVGHKSSALPKNTRQCYQ